MIKKSDLDEQWYFSDVPGDYLVVYTSPYFLLRFTDDKIMLEVFNFTTCQMFRLSREPEGNYTITVQPFTELADGYDISDKTDEVRWVTVSQKHELAKIVREIFASRRAPLPEKQLLGKQRMVQTLSDADIYNPGRLVFEK